MMHCVLMSQLVLVTMASAIETNCPHTVAFDPEALKSRFVLLKYEPVLPELRVLSTNVLKIFFHSITALINLP